MKHSNARVQLWTAFNYLPISTSKMAAKQRKLQAEYLQVRSQMVATSSQDEFAKWARLRRQHDKLLDEIEMTSQLPCSPIARHEPCGGNF